MNENKNSTTDPEAFEIWLRTVCFQKPTPDAYDLAKAAWLEASRQRQCDHIFECYIPVGEAMVIGRCIKCGCQATPKGAK